MKVTRTDRAPAPSGHYSQAISAAGWIFVSGQLPILADGRHDLAGADIERQAHQALANLSETLKAAGASLDDVVKTTVYISDIAEWGKVNAVYREVFGSHEPARSVVPVRPLHFGFGVEIEAIAHIDC